MRSSQKLSQYSPDGRFTKLYPVTNNQSHFQSVNDQSFSEALLGHQSPDKNNINVYDIIADYKSFENSPVEKGRAQYKNDQRQSLLEDNSSFYNNQVNLQENQRIKLSESPQINHKHNQENSPAEKSFQNLQTIQSPSKSQKSPKKLQHTQSPYKRSSPSKYQSPFKRQKQSVAVNDENNQSLAASFVQNSEVLSVGKLSLSPSFKNSDSCIQTVANKESQGVSHNRKSVILEQENQQLKSQIEMLKAALLGLCQNQSIQLPELLPLIDQKQKAQYKQIEQEEQTVQYQDVNQKQAHNPLKEISTGNQDRAHEYVNSPLFYQENEMKADQSKQLEISMIKPDQMEENLTQNSVNCSPQKSTNRRRRSQRQKSPLISQQNYSINESSMQKSRERKSPRFFEDMPLQIQHKKQQINSKLVQDQNKLQPNNITNTYDDTLVFDKSMDVSQNQQNLNLSQNVKSNQVTLNEDSLLMGSQIQTVNVDEESKIDQNSNQIHNQNPNEEPVQNPGDQSLIQIKYARMLEQLQNDSVGCNLETEEFLDNQDDCRGSSEVQNGMIETKDTANFKAMIDQEQNIESSPLRLRHNQLNEMQSFHNQNNQNQFDLEMPTKHKMLETLKSNQYEQEQYYVHELNQLKSELEMFEKEEEKILQMIIKPRDEDQESDQNTQENQDEQNEIIDNLKEAFLDLKNVFDVQNDDNLIKPVKILSPVEVQNIVQNATPEKYPFTSQSFLSNEKQSTTLQSFITNDQSKTPIQDKTNCFEIGFIMNKSSSKCLDNPTILGNQSTSKNYSCFKQDKNRTPTIQQLSKSPSQGALTSYKINQIEIGQTISIKTGANSSSHTPVKNRIRSDSKLKKQQQSVMSKLKHSNTKPDLHNIDNQLNQQVVHTFETIEMLAKRKSLAVGLKQQEEPDFEDKRSTVIKFDEKMFQNSGLKLIKPILMEQPTFDNQNMVSEPDDARLEIYQDQEDDYQQQKISRLFRSGIKNSKSHIGNTNYNSNRIEKQTYDLESGESSCTGLEKHRQSVEELIKESKQLMKQGHDKYFGLFSAEKSEQLKNQRKESIKKAEQMLNNLIQDKSLDRIRCQYLQSGNKKQRNNYADSFDVTPEKINERRQTIQAETENSQALNGLSLHQQIQIDSFDTNHQQSKLLNNLSQSNSRYSRFNNNEDNTVRESVHSLISNNQDYQQYQNDEISPVEVETINLQISPEKNGFDYKLENYQSQQQKNDQQQKSLKQQNQEYANQNTMSRYGNCGSLALTSKTIEQEFQQFIKRQMNVTPSASTNMRGDHDTSKSPNNLFQQVMLEPEIIQRRKSMEATMTTSSQNYKNSQINHSSNQKKRTLQLKKVGYNQNQNTLQSAEQSNYNSKHEVNRTYNNNMSNSNNTSSIQQSNFYNFQLNSHQNEQNLKRKSLAMSKTVENLRKNDINNQTVSSTAQQQTNVTQNSIKSCKQNISQNIQQLQNFKLSTNPVTVQVEEPTIIHHPHPNKMSTLDAEAFYMERSKSVIKRREELQKKKQMEMQSKIDAKNMRIESFKNTRNSQLNTSSGKLGGGSSHKYSGMIPTTDLMNIQNSREHQNIHQLDQIQLVRDTSRSNQNFKTEQSNLKILQQNGSNYNSRSVTPLKKSQQIIQEKSSRLSQIDFKQFESKSRLINDQSPNKIEKIETQIINNRPKSQSKSQIKFEKRPGQNLNQYNQSQSYYKHQNSDIYNQTQILNIHTSNQNHDMLESNNYPLNLINPGTISAKNIYQVSILPPNSQSKSQNSKLTSECSSFRRQTLQNNYSGTQNCLKNQNSASVSQFDKSENLAYQLPRQNQQQLLSSAQSMIELSNNKKDSQPANFMNDNQHSQRKQSVGTVSLTQPNHLKQNIINRTMRIQQQKPKEYTQLKMEQQKLKQTVPDSSNQSQMNQTLQNCNSSNLIVSSKLQSALSNSTSQNISMQQVVALKQKALTKQLLQNKIPQNFDNSIKKPVQSLISNSKSLQKHTNQQNSIQSSGHQIYNLKSAYQNSAYNSNSNNLNSRLRTVNNNNDHQVISNNFGNTAIHQVCFTDKKKQQQQPSSNYEGRNLECNFEKTTSFKQLNDILNSNRFGNLRELHQKERKDCLNCKRLISKGLSTEFCLDHFGSSRCIDD